VSIGRNPNGIGRLYDEVGERWGARRQRGGAPAGRIDPTPVVALGTMEAEVQSVG
jgi:hypothetical protein